MFNVYRITLSDGSSLTALIVSVKIFDKFEDAVWRKSLQPFSIISMPVRHL